MDQRFLLWNFHQSEPALNDRSQSEMAKNVSANQVDTQLSLQVTGWSTTPKHEREAT